ncbi:hypothetical protein ACNC1L_003636 [Escherichia coli]
MTALNKQARQVQRYINYGVDMMEWADGGYVRHSDYLALLKELEAAEKRIAEHNFENRLLANADRDIKALRQRIAELEAKLANPVLLPKTNGYWNEQEKAYEDAITLARRQIRLAGFRCDGDE